ncbi:MAG: hypothetical protein HY718_18055, partial [Planctomycetes bacterium]|nr:hypothetical protein [Planctomycetota bacterium]
IYEPDKPAGKTFGLGAPPSQAYVNTTLGGDYNRLATLLRKGLKANSRNHKQEGQNVAYLDGHAKWGNHPKVGVDEESIYSTWVPMDPSSNTPVGVDFKICNGVPCDAIPPSGGAMDGDAYGLMRAKSRWQTDSILIP